MRGGDDDDVHHPRRYYFLYPNPLDSGSSEGLAPICRS